ncbi:hypothetical protein NL676_021574 [Syzygium grande]|nr:hypothetical protein NL676_021574 [Syzygium grande]
MASTVRRIKLGSQGLKALKGEVRQKVELATKFGASFVDGKAEIRGDPAYVRAACEASLKRLDVDCIDLYYQHRIDTRVPIEITKLTVAFPFDSNNSFLLTLVFLKMVERELGIGIVAYGPLGRGFFSVGSKLLENLSPDDFRQSMPRFQPENLAHNAKLFDRVNEIAQRKGCTPSQLALAWVHHQGDDVCPIPGTTKIENFNQNIGALSVKLTPQEMAELESIASSDNVKGGRYASSMPT